MARTNFFEDLKKVIDDRTKAPDGLVANLQGTISESALVEKAISSQSWYALQAEFPKMPTLRDFVDAFTNQRLPIADVEAIGGEAAYPPSGSLRSGVALTLYAGLKLAGATTIPVSVTGPGHTIAIYIDDVLQSQATGSLDLNLEFTQGEHFLAIVCFGSQNAVSVTVPEPVLLTRGEPAPAAPTLIDNPIATYLAANNGSFVVAVNWSNEAYASAWQVYRARAATVGVISSFTQDTGNRYIVRVDGTITDLDVGTKLFTTNGLAGTVAAVTNLTVGTSPVTDIAFTINPDASVSAEDWTQHILYKDGGGFVSIARLTYSGDPVLSFNDTSVQQGAIYLYKVTAFGFIEGIAESDFSEMGYVLVDDLTPPGNAVFDPATDVRIVNGEVQVSFVAPTDADYHGVKVFLEDVADPTSQSIVATAFGVPGESSQVVFRPPTAGTYRLRTVDWAGNIQAVTDGVVIVYDGDSRWSRAIQGILVGIVDDAAGTVALSLSLNGLAEMFPATVTFYRDGLDPSQRIALSPGVFTTVVAAPGVVDDSLFAGLGGIPLPESGLVPFWAKIEDVDGFTTFAEEVNDRGVSPDGNVIPDDFLAFPSLVMLYDEDVDSIVVTIPNPVGGTLGTKTYSRSNGLVASGGGVVIYTVGNLIDRTGGGTATEVTLAVDASRGTYTVDYVHGTTTNRRFQGKLHGVSSAAPALEVRYVLDETTKNVADVLVRVTSPRAEPVTIEVRDDDDPTLPVWQYVAGNGDPTLKYLANGQESLALDWFHTGSTYAQKLNDIALKEGQTKFLNIRVITKDSLIPSSWMRVAMPLSAVPALSGVDLTFDENADTLRLTATGSTNCQAARFEISADETFSAGVTTVEVALASGAKFTATKGLVTADRAKTWFGRVTPFNGPLVNAHATGLGGVPQRDSQYVDQLAGNAPDGTVKLDVDLAGNLRLTVTPTNNALSFGYTLSNTAFDFGSTPTVVNFAGTAPNILSLGIVLADATKYAAVWFYEKANGAGEKSLPVTDFLRVTSTGPQIEHIYQLRDLTVTDAIRVDFFVRVSDPTTLGGTLRMWVNKNGLTSPDPSTPAEFTYAVPTTPFEVNFSNFPAALHDVLSNGAADKFVYFEFVNSAGQTTRKHEVKVTTAFSDLGPDGKLKTGTVTFNNLATSMKPVQVVGALPLSASDGDIVFLTTNLHMYQWKNNAWQAMIVGDAQGQIDGTTQIRAGSASFATLFADKITSGQIAVGAIKADQLDVNAVTAAAIHSGAVTAAKINITSLDEIVQDLGIIVNAVLRNSQATRYINLNASGTGDFPDFLHHEQFQLQANGSAVFSGKILINSDAFGNNWSPIEFLSNGGTWARIRAEKDFSLANSAIVEIQASSVALGKTSYLTIFAGQVNEVALTGADLRLFNQKLIIGNRSPYPGLFIPGQAQWEVSYTDVNIGNPSGGTNLHWLNFSLSGASKIRFKGDGDLQANSFSAYSPSPPKLRDRMSAEDWLEWAMEDAGKPVWPHKEHGMPHPDHPEVQRRAKLADRQVGHELAVIDTEYKKDISKVAIGTANWASHVMRAIEQASDFDDFKRLLGM